MTSTGGSAASAGPFLQKEHFVEQEKRCCADLSKLYRHIKSLRAITNNGNGRVCAVCGNKCHHECVECGVALHKHAPKNGGEVACFYYYHDTVFLGLAKCDYKLWTRDDGTDRKKKNYVFPTKQQQLHHAQLCRQIVEEPYNATRRTRTRNAEDLMDTSI